MALPADLSFKTKFDLTTTPASFQFQDDTDYTTLGISANDVRGVFKITDPLGNVIHNNTNFNSPDILGSTSLYYSGLPIPTDVNGDLLEGAYVGDYSIVVDDPITAINTGTKKFTIAGNKVALIPNGTTIVVVRSTAGNNGSYTVVSAVLVGADTEIEVVEAIPSSTVSGSIQYGNQEVFEVQQTATYSDQLPEVVLEYNIDCLCGTLTSTDATSYTNAVINERVHKLYYPQALNFAPITSANAQILVSPIYTETWTQTLSVDITYTLDDGSTIDATITGSQEIVVDCDLSLCQISCCLMALDNRYKSNLTTNPVTAARYFADLTRMIQLVDMFQMAQSCGQSTEASVFLTEIKTVGNCSDLCSCDDTDGPQQVVPLCTTGGSGSNVIVAAGTGISVTTTVNGNTVTYEVAIATSVMDIINSLAPVNVVGGTGITVVKTVVGGVDTYTVSATTPFVPLNTQQSKCLIEYSNFAAPTVALTVSDNVSEGANMTPMTVVSAGNVGVGLWKYQENLFTVAGFQVTPNTTFKPFVSFVQLETQTLLGAATTQGNQFTSAQPVDIRILDIGSETFNFQFVEKASGNPLSNYAMVYNYKIMVNIEIKQ